MQEKNYRYLVSVRCFTYNHSDYILDALNGFVIQQTDFPYVILLVDDASIDGESEVISNYLNANFNVCDDSISYQKETEYANIIYAQHKTNKNCFMVAMLLKYNHFQLGRNRDKLKYLAEWRDKCKYEALCEGDDYWIDSLKLQKQVNFLECNSEYTMCFHNAIERVDNKLANITFSGIKDKEYTGVMLFKKWLVPTASVVLRLDVLESDIYSRVLKSNKFIYGDTPMFCSCAELGKVRGFSDIMSVYRRHDGGMTANKFDLLDFRFYTHQEEFYHVFGKKYKSPFYISNYYAYVIIKLITQRQFSDIIKVVRTNPYPVYIPINILMFPFTYLISKIKGRFKKCLK